MSSTSTASTGTSTTGGSRSSSGWGIIVVVGAAELMTTLDGSIVNIALPSAQADLGFPTELRSWIVTAYALAFGSLLLLGGRLTTVFGLKRSFLIGLVGFAVASMLGGFAPGFGVLVTARVLQGMSAALLAPAALSLLSTSFPSGPTRTRAFGIFASLAVSGAAFGMVVGGLLTQYLDWRWCLFVNVPIAAAAFIGGRLVLPDSAAEHNPDLDLRGTATVALGLFGVVFGFAQAERNGWLSAIVLAPLVIGVALLVVFVLIERRATSPLLPLSILLDRRRGGAYLSSFVMLIAQYAVTLFLTYVLQQQLGLTPLLTGLCFLPMIAGNMISSNVVPGSLLPRISPKWLLTAGLLVAASGLFWLSFLTVRSTYLADIVGPFVLVGVGMGATIGVAINMSTLGVSAGDSGSASATMSATQQLGGSVGAALLSSIAGAATASAVGMSHDAAAIHGYTTGFLVATGILLAGAVVVTLLVPRHRPDPDAAADPADQQGGTQGSAAGRSVGTTQGAH